MLRAKLAIRVSLFPLYFLRYSLTVAFEASSGETYRVSFYACEIQPHLPTYDKARIAHWPRPK